MKVYFFLSSLAMDHMKKDLLMQVAYAFVMGIIIVTAILLYLYFCFGDKNSTKWGLSSEQIQQIPMFLHSGRAAAAASASSGCPICLEEFRRGDECRQMPGCGHQFHAGCVDQWLSGSCTCPTCRASVRVMV